MKKIFVTGFFCTSFFLYTAERQEIPAITRTKNLGDTGGERVPELKKSPRIVYPIRRNSNPDRIKHPDFASAENLVGGGRSWSPGTRLGDAFPAQAPKS